MTETGQETKNRILLSALKLFSSRGYENVSMREIADDIGIKAASIYNHYAGKEEILHACYDYFLEHRYDTRLTPEQYTPILKSGTKDEIITALYYSFREDILQFVYQAMLIVFSRVHTDEEARKIYAGEITNSLDYLVKFFSQGVEIGRMREFNVRAVSVVCLGARLFTAQSLVLSPKDTEKWRGIETEVFNELSSIIPFKY